MKKVLQVKIVGTKPLLMHAFREEMLDRKKSKEGTTGNNPMEWKVSVIMDGDRNLYLPSSYLFAPLREAGRYTKIGRGNIIKHVVSTLEILQEKNYLTRDGVQLQVPPGDELVSRDGTASVYLDVRSVVNPMTKGRNLRYRVAMSPGWECVFTLSWDDSILSVSQMNQLLNDAGQMCGTGCGRGIGMGRFKVESCEIA